MKNLIKAICAVTSVVFFFSIPPFLGWLYWGHAMGAFGGLLIVVAVLAFVVAVVHVYDDLETRE